jgi:adenosine kinase
MSKLFISGSIAYDHLMSFDGELKDSFLAEGLDELSVSFLGKDRRVEFGGCAANIAYSFSKLGGEPWIFGLAGNDFEKYAKWLDKNSIDYRLVSISEDVPSANCYLLTDNKEHQLAIFSPGAMRKGVSMIEEEDMVGLKDTDLAILSAGSGEYFGFFAEYFFGMGIPYLFDPGQEIMSMGKARFVQLLDNAKGLFLNKYEAGLIEEKFEIKLSDLCEKVDFVVVTLGDQGCELHADGKTTLVPAVSGLNVKDPTGSGDAFRAGFAHAMMDGKGLMDCCRMGNAVASFSVESFGTQRHEINEKLLNERLKRIS